VIGRYRFRFVFVSFSFRFRRRLCVTLSYLLQLNFGVTFTPGAHFWKNPDVHEFIATLLHVAANGCAGVNARHLPDTRWLFRRATAPGKAKGKNYVDEDELHRLGYTKSQLFEMLKRLPGADPKLRHVDAAPLVLPVPVRGSAPVELTNHGSPSPSPSRSPTPSSSPSPSPSPCAAALKSRGASEPSAAPPIAISTTLASNLSAAVATGHQFFSIAMPLPEVWIYG
jgi:hypothetical protein